MFVLGAQAVYSGIKFQTCNEVPPSFEEDRVGCGGVNIDVIDRASDFLHGVDDTQ